MAWFLHLPSRKREEGSTTGQIFDLSPEQETSLLDAGLSRYVVEEMQEINGQRRDEVLGSAG